MREEVAGGWRKFLNGEELHNLCCVPDIIRVIKSRMMRWTNHVTCMVDMRTAYKILFRELEGKRPLK
jgi:hypothetical protein